MNLQQQIVEDIKQYEYTHQEEGRDWGEWARLITVRKIFPNYRRGKGLRVSRDGLHFLKKLYDSYEIHIKSSKPVKTRDIVLLEKHLDYPYYVTDRILILFSERDAVDFKLYDGDFIAWCEAKRYYE